MSSILAELRDPDRDLNNFDPGDEDDFDDNYNTDYY